MKIMTINNSIMRTLWATCWLKTTTWYSRWSCIRGNNSRDSSAAWTSRLHTCSATTFLISANIQANWTSKIRISMAAIWGRPRGLNSGMGLWIAWWSKIIIELSYLKILSIKLRKNLQINTEEISTYPWSLQIKGIRRLSKISMCRFPWEILMPTPICCLKWTIRGAVSMEDLTVACIWWHLQNVDNLNFSNHS
jgi:hypothetical protein